MDKTYELDVAARRGYEDGRFARVNCNPYERIDDDLSLAYDRAWDQGYEEYLVEDADHREGSGTDDVRILF